MKTHNSSNSLRGFTLVETAIVVTVGAIILSAGLSGYKTYLNKERYETTKERINKVAKALDDYRKLPSNTNKNLPCPAPLHAAPGVAGYGHDVATTLGVACNSAPGAALGDTVSRQSGPASPAQYVRIGAVPFATLNLSAEDTQDAWGHRLIYGVSEKHTDTSTAYDANNGSITIKDDAGLVIGGDKAPFFVYTSGKSGAGSITTDGADYYVPCSAASTLEQNNCAWTTGSGATRIEFRAATYSESGGTTNFDDMVAYDYEDDDILSKCDDLNDCKSDMTSFVYLGGDDSTRSAATGTGNTAVGIGTLLRATGANNVAMGLSALSGNTSGHSNIAIGYRAAYGNIVGINNVAIGRQALYRNDGSHNVAIGVTALNNNTNTSNNVGVGAGALSNNTANNIVAIGREALAQNAGSGNTAIGYQAIRLNLDGANNTAVGYQSLYNNQQGDENTAIGKEALFSNLRGDYNTAVGSGALKISSTDTAINNTAVGYNSMSNNSDGADNTAVGANTLSANSDNSNNTAVGSGALSSNATGDNNTAVGKDALRTNWNSSRITAIGTEALGNGLTSNGPDTIAIGYRAIYPESSLGVPLHYSGQRNTAIGNFALKQATTGVGGTNDNIIIGYEAALKKNGSRNVVIGNYAMQGEGSNGPFTVNDNIAIGHQALRMSSPYGIGDTDNTAVGTMALYWSGAPGTAGNNGKYNTVLGAFAGGRIRDGYNNTAIGVNALRGSDTSVAVSAIGVDYVQGINNTAVGANALMRTNSSGATLGARNTALGANALQYNEEGNSNVAIGNSAGPPTGHTNRLGTVAIGDNALTTNNGSIAIGYNARIDSTGPWSTGGVAIGSGAIAVNNGVAIGPGAVAQNGSIAIGAGATAFWSPGGSGGSSGCSGCSNSGTGEIKLQAVGNLRVARRDLGDDWHGPSDGRLKKDITDSDLGLAFIEKLHPVSYRMKWATGGPVTYGFIAQEVEKALDGRQTSIIARLQDEMKTYIMSKGALIPSIVKAVQEIAARLNPLEKTVAEQKVEISNLKQALADQQAKIQILTKMVEGMTGDKALPKHVNHIVH